MTRTYRCNNCGATLDPSAATPTLRCPFCGTVAEKDQAPQRASKEESKKGEKKRSDWFFAFYLGGIAVVAVGGFGYVYLVPQRTVVGKPIVSDVTGDGIEDVLLQWDEELHNTTTSRVGLIDGKSREVSWSFAFSKKKYSNPIPMAIGKGYVILGEPKPIANILDARTGTLKHQIDLPDVASRVYASDVNVWLDTDRKSLQINAQTGEIAPAKSPVGHDLDRPAWAPSDANQSCPMATCRSSAPMAIADMNVHQVYVDGSRDDAVAVGQKENGTHLPMLAGISLSKKATRWSRVLPASDAATPQHPVLVRERIYFEYADGKLHHLACASAATGEIVWDVPSEENARYAYDIVVGNDVYVRRGGKLELHDAKTGKLVTHLP
jgi:outer membrane protein assembly factor BamB